jgi:hypothetical protein
VGKAEGAGHSPPTSAKVKNANLYIHSSIRFHRVVFT